MKPARFDYHRPASLDDALALLARHGDEARIIAGGQSLVPMMNMRIAAPGHLVDLGAIAGLDGIRDAGGSIEIGAMAKQHDVAVSPLVREACPLLAAGVASIGHYAIRQRGTLGGSLAHADPAAQLPLLAVTLDAEVDVAGPRGRRTVSASTFFVALMTTALDAGEIVVAARFPKQRAGSGWGFELFSRRHGDFAIFAAAVLVSLDAAGRARRLKIGAGGASPVPFAIDETDASLAVLAGERPDERWCARAAETIASRLDPDDDARVPAAFRVELARSVTGRALAAALARCGGVASPRHPA